MIIIALKKWQLIEQEVIDVQMAIDHMNAFIQALEYESYSKENCQRVAERSVGKFLYNREAFFRANTENNIAEAIAEKYTECFVELLEELDLLVAGQTNNKPDRPCWLDIELSNNISFYKKDGVYITNLQNILEKYINYNILRCHNYADMINKDNIKISCSEEVLPISSNVIIRWFRKSFSRQSKWQYYIDDDKFLSDHTICKAVCDDFYNTGYVQALADELRQLLLSKIENYFEERGE